MACAKDSSDTEDDEIKQALFLVHLLKSDYAKLMLRENPEPTEELSTCPLTTENSSSVVSHTTPLPFTNVTTEANDTTTALNLSPVESSSTASTKLLVLTTKQIERNREPVTEISSTPEDMLNYPGDYPSYENAKRRRKLRNYRRRIMPMEYDYYYDMPARPEFFRLPRTYRPYRNINYRNENYRRMGPVDTDVNLTQSLSSPRPSDSSTKANRTSGSKKSRLSSLPPTRSANTTPKIIAKAATNFKYKVIAENIVMPQVARELFNELKGGGLTMEQSTTTKRNLRTRTIKTGKSMKFSDFVKRYADALKQRTTLKIYLDHSTRLPVPLPENNAYCFMNPKSALCRTNI